MLTAIVYFNGNDKTDFQNYLKGLSESYKKYFTISGAKNVSRNKVSSG